MEVESGASSKLVAQLKNQKMMRCAITDFFDGM
jgi:hypothetical protein